MYLAFSDATVEIASFIEITPTATPKNPIDKVIKLPYILTITPAKAVWLLSAKNKEPGSGFKKLTSKNGTALNITLSAQGNSFVPVNPSNIHPTVSSIHDAT